MQGFMWDEEGILLYQILNKYNIDIIFRQVGIHKTPHDYAPLMYFWTSAVSMFFLNYISNPCYTDSKNVLSQSYTLFVLKKWHNSNLQ